MEKKKSQIYESLKNEVVYLFAKRTIYKALYEDNEQRLGLLKETAPILSVIFQKMLLDDMAITICRILDPKQTGGYENNTLFQLIDKYDPCFEELQDLSDQISPLRRQRNKFLAHRDLIQTLDHFKSNTENGKTLLKLNFPISMSKLDDFLEKMKKLLSKYADANMLYDNTNTEVGPDFGVKKLIDLLKLGRFFQDLQHNQEIDFVELLPQWETFKYKDA